MGSKYFFRGTILCIYIWLVYSYIKGQMSFKGIVDFRLTQAHFIFNKFSN